MLHRENGHIYKEKEMKLYQKITLQFYDISLFNAVDVHTQREWTFTREMNL